MNFKWDFSKLNDFGKQLTDETLTRQLGKDLTVEVTQHLHEHLFERTPVVTGNLVSAWGGEENYAYKVNHSGNNFKCQLVNNGASEDGFMYGYIVNDGNHPHCHIPRYFVEKSILDTEDEMNKIGEKSWKKWWKGVTHDKSNHR